MLYAPLYLSKLFLPNPSFLLCYPATLHSPIQPQIIDKVSSFDNQAVEYYVLLFNRMLNLCPAPPVVEFGEILGSLAKMKHYPIVVSLSKQMESVEISPNTVTLSILINCYCHLGEMDLAFSVFAKILKKGFLPNAITLTTLMKGLCLKGEVEKALNFHDSVVVEGYKLNEFSYGTLINGLCKVGQTKAAMDLLRRIRRQGVEPK